VGAALARWRRRLGWRGTALLCCGIPWIVYGIGLMTTPRAGLVRAASVITALMGLHCWGTVWVLCGGLACVAAILRPGRDQWGFALAAGPPLIWSMAYITAAATGGYREAWASVPLLIAPVLLLVVVAEVTGRRRRHCTCGRGRHGR
jgi:hypothetical protein